MTRDENFLWGEVPVGGSWPYQTLSTVVFRGNFTPKNQHDPLTRLAAIQRQRGAHVNRNEASWSAAKARRVSRTLSVVSLGTFQSVPPGLPIKRAHPYSQSVAQTSAWCGDVMISPTLYFCPRAVRTVRADVSRSNGRRVLFFLVPSFQFTR